MEFVTDGMLYAFAGMAGGVVLGLAARLGRFCTLGAIEDLLYGGDDTRMRMWGLAIATAMGATFAMVGAGIFALEETIYHQAAFSPLARFPAGGSLAWHGAIWQLWLRRPCADGRRGHPRLRDGACFRGIVLCRPVRAPCAHAHRLG